MRLAALLICALLLTPGRGAMSGENSRQWEWSGAFGPHSEFTAEVIRDADSWRRLWTLLRKAPPPEFDAARHIALAVFLGLRNTGGYDVTIEPVAGSDAWQIFRLREIRPGPNALVPQVLTTPYRILVLPVRSGPVFFLLGGPAGECLYMPAGERARAEPMARLPAAPLCPKAQTRRKKRS